MGGNMKVLAFLGSPRNENSNTLLILSMEFSAALLRPTGELMKPMMEMGMDMQDIFEASKEAGRQYIQRGQVSGELLETISRPLVTPMKYREMTNQYFEQLLASGSARSDT